MKLPYILLCTIQVSGIFAIRSSADISELQTAVKNAIRSTQSSLIEVSAHRDADAVDLSPTSPHTVDRVLDSSHKSAAPFKGSGFFVSTNGLIVTAAHTVHGASSIFIKRPNGDVHEAALIGLDRQHDLALLQAPVSNAVPLSFASPEAYEAGEFAIAMGYPFGLGASASFGIISSSGQHLDDNRSGRLIQTDAAINSGNSGGPLITIDGRVMGMQSVVLAPEGVHSGMGFAVPSDVIQEEIRRFTAAPSHASWFGVLPGSDKEALRVAYVVPGSPAAAAGLVRGDVLTHINGQDAGRTDLARLRLQGLHVGQTCEFHTKRGARAKVVSAERPGTVSFYSDAGLHHEPLKERPLTPTEDRILSEAVNGAICSCSLHRPLAECDNCSEAKELYTLLRNQIIRGIGPDELPLSLKPPVVIQAWVDYSRRDSHELIRVLEAANLRLGGLVRIVYRHFPTSAVGVDAWRQGVNAVEVARQYGQVSTARLLLSAENRGNWSERLALTSEQLLVPADSFARALKESQYEKQIWKDLTDGPAVYEVTAAPSLFIGGERFSDALEAESIHRRIEEALFALTL